jgi:hypothetical protein
MAFCNSCGAALEPGAQFCNKCGGKQAATSPASPATTAAGPATPAQGSSALKIILIVVAVIVGLGILGVGAVSYVAYRAVKGTRVEQKGDKVKVETTFGKVETSGDSADVIRDLGVDVYPGAEVLDKESAIMNIGGMRTATAQFESSDSVEDVANFYRQKYPSANYTANNENRTIFLTDKDRVLTITVESRDGKTHIGVSNITGKNIPGSR